MNKEIEDMYLDCDSNDRRILGLGTKEHEEAYMEAFNMACKCAKTSKNGIGASAIFNQMVDSPPHYNQGGIETIDYMKAYSTKEEFMGHCRLTTIKYLSRLMEKENPLQDAKKARWYLNKLIEELIDYEEVKDEQSTKV